MGRKKRSFAFMRWRGFFHFARVEKKKSDAGDSFSRMYICQPVNIGMGISAIEGRKGEDKLLLCMLCAGRGKGKFFMLHFLSY